ncbi:pyruvate/2-oxoglutarate dehydrogenase complex dihydrolipoamide dehydrogenase (E3) component [Ancylobacter aquaticus]|uniref:Pyruvate/2-oxoglutarate dehydrogenase complex dihydrolipoamide dehydrogenase (E3) component n=1 Tax=Ancylobacter aquaticus TaxID=100 RepID=A0A4R1HSK8_ANCAQ|nr:NAD(P)/FAD-dependent oxidoreductase [Ancylobacter aquaticus]TCK23560.1 pyruvate/2-oxoglutarate dehydrogenase complex dihydrolipoamide dehydrogenase (E3) component [Ancylobacter aquaticus]
MSVDPRSVAGKTLSVAGHAQLLVIGAGPAGLAAAIEGAQRGLSVVLVDENPVPFETMGESVPLHFGGRVGGVARNRNAMMEAMLESAPDLATAFELGVDVRLGTACWGLYANGANLGWMPGPLAGLADEESGTYLVSFERAIVATGRRDMGLAFPGWEAPGVMGATAAVQLATRYGALAGTRAVVLGTTAEALLAALALRAQGIAVAAVIEQAPAPVGPDDLVAELRAAGVAIRCGEVVRAVETDLDGVRGVTTSAGVLACDLVVLGIGAVPMVDLLDAAGCVLAFDAARGGYAPVLDEAARTSVAVVQAVGDCAGIWPAKSGNVAIAEMEARYAAAVAASALGEAGEAPSAAPPPGEATYDIDAYRKDWVRASVIEAAGEPYVCQCEEVTAREILDVRPPRYLDWQGADNRPRSLASLLGEGPPHPDQIKRLTRAGMGPCQGRRCREQIQALLALQAAVPLDAVPLAGYRAPVRPLPLKAAAPQSEDAAFGEQWDSWFGMPRQWVPFWDVEEEYTVAGLAVEKPHASE